MLCAHGKTRRGPRRAATLGMALLPPFLNLLVVAPVDSGRASSLAVRPENCARNGAAAASNHPNASHDSQDPGETVLTDGTHRSPQPTYVVPSSASPEGPSPTETGKMANQPGEVVPMMRNVSYVGNRHSARVALLPPARPIRSGPVPSSPWEATRREGDPAGGPQEARPEPTAQGFPRPLSVPQAGKPTNSPAR